MKITALLFPGQAALVPGLLQSLAELEPAAAQILHAAEQASQKHFGTSLMPYLAASAPPPSLAASQLLLVATDLAVHHALTARAVIPDFLIGHSLGEIAALCAAGVMDTDTMMHVVCLRVEALSSHAEPGGLVAVATDRQTAMALATLAGDRVSLAVVNGPGQCVLSVVESARPKLEALLVAAGLSSTRLEAPFPFHGPGMAKAAEQFTRSLSSLRFAKPQTPLLSPIFGAGAWQDPSMVAALAGRALVEPVDYEAVIRNAHNAGIRTFIESGGRKALTTLAKAILSKDPDVTVVAPAQQAGDLESGLLQAAGVARGNANLGSQDPLRRLSEILTEAGQLLQALQFSSSKTSVQPKGEMGMKAPMVAAQATPPVQPVVQTRVAPEMQVTPPPSMKETPSVAQQPGKQAIEQRIVALLQRITEYPADVFEPNLDLEADLGIDSLKQVAVLGEIQKEFNLPARTDLKVKDYGSLAKLVAMVADALSPSSSLVAAEPFVLSTQAPSPIERTPAPSSNSGDGKNSALLTADAIQQRIVALLQRITEYPADVFEPNLDFEADLGIDSLKQVAVLGEIQKEFNLPPRSDLKVKDYGSLSRLVTMVDSALSASA